MMKRQISTSSCGQKCLQRALGTRGFPGNEPIKSESVMEFGHLRFSQIERRAVSPSAFTATRFFVIIANRTLKQKHVSDFNMRVFCLLLFSKHRSCIEPEPHRGSLTEKLSTPSTRPSASWEQWTMCCCFWSYSCFWMMY